MTCIGCALFTVLLLCSYWLFRSEYLILWGLSYAPLVMLYGLVYFWICVPLDSIIQQQHLAQVQWLPLLLTCSLFVVQVYVIYGIFGLYVYVYGVYVYVYGIFFIYGIFGLYHQIFVCDYCMITADFHPENQHWREKILAWNKKQSIPSHKPLTHCLLETALLVAWVLESPCQYCVLRGSDRARMGSEQCLFVRECGHA